MGLCGDQAPTGTDYNHRRRLSTGAGYFTRAGCGMLGTGHIGVSVPSTSDVRYYSVISHASSTSRFDAQNTVQMAEIINGCLLRPYIESGTAYQALDPTSAV
jgi:hypothetical protein